MNNIQKIKHYFKIAQPKASYIIVTQLLFIVLLALNLYTAIPTANVTTSISAYDFNKTMFWLIIVCAIVVIKQIIQIILNRIYYKTYNNIWTNVYGKIYDKISNTTSEGFTLTSKEKIINIAFNNVGTLCEFSDYLTKYISYFIEAVITIIILLSYNIIIGAVIILICVLIFFIQSALNKKIGALQSKYYEYQDKSLETLSDNYKNHALSHDLNINEVFKDRYIKHLNTSQNYKIKYGRLLSVTQNWFPFCYKVIVCLLSIYMVYLTKSNIFTLTIYIVLSTYLTQALTQMANSYNLLRYINNMSVAALRIQTILDMPEQDLISYGNNIQDDISGGITFNNVSYKPKDNSNKNMLETFNIKIAQNSCTLIYGSHLCGKRSIYNMLNRSVKPSTGTITIDNINIYDFNQETYKHNIAVVSNKEYFYNDTIMNNMLLSGASKQQIYKVCKDFGIHNKIVSSQLSYNTNLKKDSTVLSAFDTYLLGVARALCTNAEIIVLYEFPSGLSTEQKDKLKDILKLISKEHTLLIFSYNTWASDICNNVYKIEKGKILFK